MDVKQRGQCVVGYLWARTSPGLYDLSSCHITGTRALRTDKFCFSAQARQTSSDHSQVLVAFGCCEVQDVVERPEDRKLHQMLHLNVYRRTPQFEHQFIKTQHNSKSRNLKENSWLKFLLNQIYARGSVLVLILGKHVSGEHFCHSYNRKAWQ